MNKKILKSLNWIFILIYLSIIFFFVFGKRGVIAYQKLEQRSHKLGEKVQAKKDNKEFLNNQYQALLSKSEYYETVIKNKLLYIKENEIIIFFPNSKE